MRLLIAHVGYRQRGGEDQVVAMEARLLREAGHDVSVLVVPSEKFSTLPRGVQLAIGTHFGDHNYGRVLIQEAVDSSHPQVVHFHNLYPLLGPGAILQASELGCATVQTFHNYRMSCIAGTHFREGSICERCAPSLAASGVLRRCYRGSLFQSLAMARGSAHHWRTLTELQIPDVGVCLTKFMRDRLVESGALEESIVVKPNSVDASQRVVSWGERSGVVFVGRLSREKGVLELVEAWPEHAPTLTVIGDGPLLSRVSAVCGLNVRVLGGIPSADVRAHVSGARALVLPSLWFEGLPLVVLEAMAEATPAVGFSVGAMPDLARSCGMQTTAHGDIASLCAAAMSWALAGESVWNVASAQARLVHADRYSHVANTAALEALYSLALDRSNACRR